MSIKTWICKTTSKSHPCKPLDSSNSPCTQASMATCWRMMGHTKSRKGSWMSSRFTCMRIVRRHFKGWLSRNSKKLRHVFSISERSIWARKDRWGKMPINRGTRFMDKRRRTKHGMMMFIATYKMLMFDDVCVI